MQIFPAYETVGRSSNSQFMGFDGSFLGRPDADFSDVFNSFMRNTGDHSPMRGPVHERASMLPAPVHGDPPASVHQRELPADREDFARLRERLEALGVDRDVLDRAEELFDRPEPVTWGQVYDVLREPLEEKAGVKLTPDQEQDILSLFSKMGFTPQDAKALLNDVLHHSYDAVWKKLQQMAATLAGGENIGVTLKEIAALLKALGLDMASLTKPGQKSIDPGTQASPQKTMDATKLSPENQAALQTVLDAAKGEAKPGQDILAAIKTALDAAGGDTAKLGQLLEQMGDRELSVDELRRLLAMLKEAAKAGAGPKGEMLAEVHAAMAAAEAKEQRMAQADRMDGGTGMNRLSQTDPLTGLKDAANAKENGSEHPGRNGGRNAQQNNAGNKSAQGWENFWEKVNIKNSAPTQAPAATVRDIGIEGRPVAGPAVAASEAENAARRIISNAPAPHRTILHQVHSGLMQNMGQGRQQLTLHLNPPDLGSLTVNLKVIGKEVQAVLRADSPEARQAIAENLPLLRQSLESQGLKVSRLEVQTQMQDNHQFSQLWQGADGRKSQEQGTGTRWNSLGRGQSRNGSAEGQDSPAEQTILHANGREGGINLIA